MTANIIDELLKYNVVGGQQVGCKDEFLHG
jgi:hypothetical protein